MNWFNFIGGDSIESKVNACIEKFERNDIQSLQYSLYELYSEFNRPGGGRKIIDFNHKRTFYVFCVYKQLGGTGYEEKIPGRTAVCAAVGDDVCTGAGRGTCRTGR